MNSRLDYEIADDETTDEQWHQIEKLATKGDIEKLTDLLLEVGIDPRTARLFVVAVAEHKRLIAMIATAGEAAKELTPLDRELKALLRSFNTDNSPRISEIEQQIAKLREQQGNAHAASVWRNGIVRRFPRLFNQKPVVANGVVHWAPVVDSASPALHDELQRLGLPVDMINPHQHFPLIEPPRKPRTRVPAFASQSEQKQEQEQQ